RARRHDRVDADACDVGAEHAAELGLLLRISGAEDRLPRHRAEDEPRQVEAERDREELPADVGEVLAVDLDGVEEVAHASRVGRARGPAATRPQWVAKRRGIRSGVTQATTTGTAKRRQPSASSMTT